MKRFLTYLITVITTLLLVLLIISQNKNRIIKEFLQNISMEVNTLKDDITVITKHSVTLNAENRLKKLENKHFNKDINNLVISLKNDNLNINDKLTLYRELIHSNNKTIINQNNRISSLSSRIYILENKLNKYSKKSHTHHKRRLKRKKVISKLKCSKKTKAWYKKTCMTKRSMDAIYSHQTIVVKDGKEEIVSSTNIYEENSKNNCKSLTFYLKHCK